MNGILDEIIANKRHEVEAQKHIVSEDQIFEMARSAKRSPLSLSKAVAGNYSGVIAEFKRCSPSRGNIHPNADTESVIKSYVAHGAPACSITTDTRFYGGSITDLMIANKCVDVPLLRNDFFIDKYQIAQSFIAGADAVNLIAAILSRVDIAAMVELAHYFNMEAVVEVHTLKDIEKIPEDTDIVSVSNRNRSTMITDVDSSYNLIGRLPQNMMKITASGICSHYDIHRLRTIGYSGFIIGETFMKKDSPGQALHDFLNPVRHTT